MKSNDASDFFSSLKKSDPLPVYLFHGEDSRLIGKALEAVVKKVDLGDLSDFNSDFFHGKESDPGSVIAAARTLPMMADRRLVVVKRVDEWKGKAREALLDYLLDPSPTTVLAMSAEGLSLRGASAKKEDKDLEKAVNKTGQAVRFARPSRARLPAVIREMFAERGKRIGGEAVDLLIDLAGDETRGLEHQVDKVAIFVGEKDAVSRQDVLEAVADVKEANVFEFTDAIGAHDLEGALRSYRRMRDQGQEPLMILAMLARHFRNLWRIGELAEEGESPVAIAKRLKMNEWVVKKSYMPQLPNFPLTGTGGVMKALADLDIQLKSTRTDREVVFERTVIRLCSGKL